LASTVVAIGVPPDAINGISLQVGSIIAEVKLEGMEYGRIIAEAVKDRLVVVLVDGSVLLGMLRTGRSIRLQQKTAAKDFCSATCRSPCLASPNQHNSLGLIIETELTWFHQNSMLSKSNCKLLFNR